jgi:hypothetical protein
MLPFEKMAEQELVKEDELARVIISREVSLLLVYF